MLTYQYKTCNIFVRITFSMSWMTNWDCYSVYLVGGRTGISWPTFESGHNNAPLKPHDGLMSYNAISGLLTVTSNTMHLKLYHVKLVCKNSLVLHVVFVVIWTCFHFFQIPHSLGSGMYAQVRRITCFSPIQTMRTCNTPSMFRKSLRVIAQRGHKCSFIIQIWGEFIYNMALFCLIPTWPFLLFYSAK